MLAMLVICQVGVLEECNKCVRRVLEGELMMYQEDILNMCRQYIKKKE